MYPDALDCGISVKEFWELSMLEISDIMESFKRRRTRDLKQELINGFAFAEHTAELVGLYLSSENTARKIWDFFPELFSQEKTAYDEIEVRRQMEQAKENRRAYAAEIKRRREMGLM